MYTIIGGNVSIRTPLTGLAQPGPAAPERAPGPFPRQIRPSDRVRVTSWLISRFSGFPSNVARRARVFIGTGALDGPDTEGGSAAVPGALAGPATFGRGRSARKIACLPARDGTARRLISGRGPHRRPAGPGGA